MCGRYVRKNDAERVHSFFEVIDVRAPWTPSYNVAPTTQVPVIRQMGASREMGPFGCIRCRGTWAMCGSIMSA
ncbi:MAG: SOS response-associated peptidase family protein [Chthoniobacterales bacterium]